MISKIQFFLPLQLPFLQGNLWGSALRLAFHDAGEVLMTNTTDMMGPDGCLSSDPASNGLNTDDCLTATVIEPFWQNYCDYISRADFWVLFAKIVIEYAESTGHLNFPFQYGRVDATTSCEAGYGRLPDATRGMPAIVDLFVNNMQMTLEDGAALIGGHSVGHVHLQNSDFTMAGDNTADDGLVNGWDTTPHIFDNKFYIQMLTFNWHNMLNPDGTKAEWKRNPLHQYAIMLNTDMALAYDLDVTNGIGITGQVCGPFGTEMSSFGCYPSSTMMPATCNAACRFANNLNVWLDQFATSFTTMTTRGYGSITSYADGTPSTGGKLGTLTSIDLTTC